MHAFPFFTSNGRFATGFATGLQLECNCNATAMQLAYASGSLPPGSPLPVLHARPPTRPTYPPTYGDRANAAFLKRRFCAGAGSAIMWVLLLSPYAYLLAARVRRAVVAGFSEHVPEPTRKRPGCYRKTGRDRKSLARGARRILSPRRCLSCISNRSIGRWNKKLTGHAACVPIPSAPPFYVVLAAAGPLGVLVTEIISQRNKGADFQGLWTPEPPSPQFQCW